MSVSINQSDYVVTINETTNVVEVAAPGPSGVGVPAGGSTGQVLKKSSGTNYATEWGTAGSGTVTAVQATSPIVSDGNSATPTITHATTLGGNSTVAFITSMSVNTFGHITALTGVDASTMRGAMGLKNSAVLDVGTGSSTVAAGDDSRLSNARTPVAHSADLVTSGTLGVDRIPTLTLSKISDAGTAAAADTGTGSSNVILGNDARLADDRDPNDHSTDKLTSGTLAVARGGTGSATAPMVGVVTAADAAAARTVLGLGTAATSATGDFSPVAGSGSIVTTGTIASGTWNATAIEDTKLDLRVDHGVTFDGGGAVVETAKVVYVPVERAGVIKAATLVGDASGAITITITKYDPAADATTLGSPSAVGTIALATKIINRDTTLSGWTLAVAEGDILAFTTGGTIATVTRVTCKLKLELA